MALSKILLSIDPSLRSTGYNFINTETKEVIHYGIIASDIPADNGEELLLNISGDLLILKKMMFGKEKIDMVIEGLSFGSKTGMRDLIDALHWHIRTMYRFSFSDALIGVAPPNTWRNALSTPQERKDAKANLGKDHLKKMMVNKLPEELRKKYLDYIKSKHRKKESIYDLADSYWIGQYRITLEENK